MSNSGDAARRSGLHARLVVAMHTVRSLLGRIQEIEDDTETSANEKLSEIKKIRDEITKVGTEIDSIKREITLLTAYSLN